MPTFEEEIARSIRESERSGEMASVPGYGKPLAFEDGYAQTPEELRMPFKILKDAGFVPHEVQMLAELARVRERLRALPQDCAEAVEIRRSIADLELRIAVRLERLSGHREL